MLKHWKIVRGKYRGPVAAGFCLGCKEPRHGKQARAKAEQAVERVGYAAAAREEENFAASEGIRARWAGGLQPAAPTSSRLTLSTPTHRRVRSEAPAAEAAHAQQWELDVVSVN